MISLKTASIILLPIFESLKDLLADDNFEGPKVTRGRSYTGFNRPDTQQREANSFIENYLAKNKLDNPNKIGPNNESIPEPSPDPVPAKIRVLNYHSNLLFFFNQISMWDRRTKLAPD